ncbi:FAD-dependent 5-carboxymethylaminomethyl-2-thiouridine(34) oxidoreductase MnmC [Psychrobacter jeotgali]|uniref:FAD-dependent 5-carboxymethylaminomethyl-2-thiouridine(34) oxidoreductase MnmC n=1 Tax=Psychrobacter jeotgali TaxID=179010 RepID=UPI0019182693|nr:FAD-dependent 5-carboxymethylaminomethyl-2-thiouridine(34) oxidoreductase MnmC [Psychrobacter jeotgali]
MSKLPSITATKADTADTNRAKTARTNIEKTEYSNIISPANIDWQTDDTGNQVPVSGEFGDVYFSHADGLAESRHVFITGNNLPERLANLAPYQCFTVAELGFGTGLNVLALWELWQQLRTTHPNLASARLHIITTEKHPIALEDLSQILRLWKARAPELSDLIELLLSAYPTLIAGCHRLNFDNDNLTLDIWLGDAADSLAKLATDIEQKNADANAYVDAWLLDGFAPSCNESLWATSIFAQLQRLSHSGTTAATYSCAGVVKRGLQASGFTIKKVKGFGRKREMLTAVIEGNSELAHSAPIRNTQDTTDKPRHTIVIGAGVSGLMSAWSLANRGIKVTLLDKIAPLAGASGNPRALLAPKMTPIHHADEHLHTIGYLYSSRLYQQLNDSAAKSNTAPVIELTGALDLLIKANIDSSQIADYPDDMATTLATTEAQQKSGLKTQDLGENLYLPQSGLVNPQALKAVILAHPLISFRQLTVAKIAETETHVSITGSDKQQNTLSVTADNVVICAAYESHYLDKRIFDCRKIRGQLSWFIPTKEQISALPKIPLKYSGYCATFVGQQDDRELNKVVEAQTHFLMGASFIRNETVTDIRDNEHQVSRDKLVTAIPELAEVIAVDTAKWQARAGVRTQTPDYHPMVGPLANSARLWTLSAMGAKGYAFAPICAEALADMMLGKFAPLSEAMLKRLSPNRTRLQTPLADLD